MPLSAWIHSVRGCNDSLCAILISLFVGESDVACQVFVREGKPDLLIYSPAPGVVETNELTINHYSYLNAYYLNVKNGFRY